MAKGIKTGGRQQGTPNRLTKEIKAVLKDVVFDELSSLKENLSGVDQRTRLEILVKLIPYICPKSKPCSHSFDEFCNF